MALHRDIFWVGRQWAVTGSGVQAVDQRLRGVLDIELARLWDDDYVQSRRAKPGVNAADFDKAVAVARERYPKAPVVAPVIAQRDKLSAAESTSAANEFEPAMKLRAEGSLARFLPQWRIRR
ncbi:hypothetical protein [Bradyrhizobium sp.]|uniref:hypothetical protein n=1 Tax=Bradyrhizobium sp. TaxID=376 RepID=UPI0039E5D8F7